MTSKRIQREIDFAKLMKAMDNLSRNLEVAGALASAYLDGYEDGWSRGWLGTIMIASPTELR